MARINPNDLVRNFYDSFSGIRSAGKAAIGGVVAALGIAAVALIDGVQALFTEPLGEVASGSAGVINGLIGGAADILNQASATAVQSLAPGQAWAIGPITYLLGIAVMGAAMYLFAQILQVPATSDLLPFTGTDVPGAGAEEEDG